MVTDYVPQPRFDPDRIVWRHVSESERQAVLAAKHMFRCERLNATISHASCDLNKGVREGCAGCPGWSGLDPDPVEQAEEPKAPVEAVPAEPEKKKPPVRRTIHIKQKISSTCTCPVCGKEFPSAAKVKRRCCSKDCSRMLRAMHDKHDHYSEGRTCSKCGGPITNDNKKGICVKCKKNHEKFLVCRICGVPINDKNRSGLCVKCKGKLNYEQIQKAKELGIEFKYCVHCGAAFIPKRPIDIYCSPECSYETVKKNNRMRALRKKAEKALNEINGTV